MTKRPQISIIVPIYNTERFLCRCIDSILTQTFTDYELLLIDDGSTDGSGAICDAYAEKDSRVRVSHKENGGVSSARNLGLKEAKGEWVYFPDSDDIIVEDALSMMICLISDNIDYVICGYEVYNEMGQCTYAISEKKQCVLTQQDALMEMFRPSDYYYQGYLWNKLFKASIIRENALAFEKEIKFNEDRLFNVGYLCHINRNVAYSTAPVYKYYERSTGAMASLTQRFNPFFLTDLDAFIKIGDLLRANKLDISLKEAHLSAMLCSAGRMYSLCKQYGKLNLAWRFAIERRIYAGVGFRLYVKRWTSKVEHKIKRMLNKQ